VRTTGEPASGNGASSFHLWWEPPPPPADEIAVTLTVEDEPRHDRLVFWALQVEFRSGFRHVGGAHIGLQWNRRHVRSRAVNWGGYDGSGKVLAGSESTLPSTPGDPNTRDFPWEPGRPYRLTVRPGSAPGRWLGVVTDMTAGSRVQVRELFGGGGRLARPVVWSEVFARCEGPSVAATWSDPVTEGPRGRVAPGGYRVSYQSEEAGGCSNTTVVHGPGGVRQITAAVRTTQDGSLIPVG